MTQTTINVATHDNDTTDIQLSVDGVKLTATLGANSSSVDLPTSVAPNIVELPENLQGAVANAAIKIADGVYQAVFVEMAVEEQVINVTGFTDLGIAPYGEAKEGIVVTGKLAGWDKVLSAGNDWRFDSNGALIRLNVQYTTEAGVVGNLPVNVMMSDVKEDGSFSARTTGTASMTDDDKGTTYTLRIRQDDQSEQNISDMATNDFNARVTTHYSLHYIPVISETYETQVPADAFNLYVKTRRG